MKNSNFRFDEIKTNFSNIKKDKQQVWFEIIYAAIPILFYLIIVWLPFFTVKLAPRRHFSLFDFRFFFKTIFYTAWLTIFCLYLFSRVTILKPFSFFILGFLFVLELVYFAFCINQYSVTKIGFSGFANVNLNVGFYFMLLHMSLLAVVIIMPSFVKQQIEKILSKKSDSATKATIEPAEKEVAKDQEKPKRKQPKADVIKEENDLEESIEIVEQIDVQEETEAIEPEKEDMSNDIDKNIEE